MKIKIDVTLNEKGQKLTSKKTHSIKVTREGVPGEGEIEKIIEEEVPKELIDGYDVILGGFVELEVGDFVRVIDTSNKTYLPYVITKVSKINDKSIFVEGYYSTSFDYDGNEKGGRRKSKLKLDLPTQDDIDEYNERLKRDSLVSSIKEVVEDWDELGVYKTEVLEEINKLLRDGNSKLPLFS